MSLRDSNSRHYNFYNMENMKISIPKSLRKKTISTWLLWYRGHILGTVPGFSAIFIKCSSSNHKDHLENTWGNWRKILLSKNRPLYHRATENSHKSTKKNKYTYKKLHLTYFYYIEIHFDYYILFKLNLTILYYYILRRDINYINNKVVD